MMQGSRRVAPRWAIAGVIGLLFSVVGAPPAAAEPPGTGGAPVLDPTTLDYAHLRVTLTANSGWAMATFTNLEIIDHRLVSGPAISVGSTSLSYAMGTGSPVTAVLELIVSSPISSSMSMTTTKGNAGSFTVDADSVSQSGTATDAFNVVNSQTSAPGDNAMATNLTRADVLGDGLDVGPIDDERLVMAMVHPWWDNSVVPPANTTTQYNAITPDKPADPWRSDIVADVEDNVDLMADAGIDVAIYSYGWGGYATDPKVENLLDAVDADGRMLVAPVIEMEATKYTTTCTLLQVLQGCVPHEVLDTTHIRAIVDAAMDDVAANPSGFLHRDELPVVFFYGDWWFTTAEWNWLAGQFVADGNELFAITHVEDAARTTEGYWNYIGAASGLTETQYTTETRGRTFRNRLHPLIVPGGEQRLVVGSVWPGYNNSSQNNGTPQRYEDRQSGAFYDTRWQATLWGLPDWVVVTSWNEWWEQTHVAPSVSAGTTALDQTADWAAIFHAS